MSTRKSGPTVSKQTVHYLLIACHCSKRVPMPVSTRRQRRVRRIRNDEQDVIVIDDDDDDRKPAARKKSKHEEVIIIDDDDDDDDVMIIWDRPGDSSAPTPGRTLRQIRRDAFLARQLQQDIDDEEVKVIKTTVPTYDVLQSYRENIETTVATKSRGFIKVVDVQHNPHSQVDTPLYRRFVSAWQQVEDQSVIIVFHGSAEANMDSICQNGLDPKCRAGQAMGPGEYFASDIQTAYGYCRGGKKMLVMAVLADSSGVTAQRGTIWVIHKPEHHLPLGVITFG